MATITDHPGRVTGRQATATRRLGLLSAYWGVGGVLLMLGSALYRLLPVAADSLRSDLGARHWVVLTLGVALMAYAEGYRGFQQSLAPRVAERARELQQQPRWDVGLLAPAFCIGVVAAPRREVIGRLALIAMIVGFVVSVRLLEPPWRGLIDVGVIVGLSWGAVSVALHAARTLTDDRPDGDGTI